MKTELYDPYPTREDQAAYWRRRLSGDVPILNLPLDYPRPPVSSFVREREQVDLGQELYQQLTTFSAQYDYSCFVILLTTLKILLLRYTGEKDLIVGGMSAIVHSMDRVEGEEKEWINNPIALRTDLAGNLIVSQVFSRVADTVSEAVAHGQYPLQEVLQNLGKEKSIESLPFKIMFEMEENREEISTAGKSETPSNLLQEFSVQCDFILKIFTKQHFVVQVEYDAELFVPTTIQRLVTHYHTLLAGLVSDPTRSIIHLSFLTEAERHQLLVDWNPPVVRDQSFTCIHDLLEAQAARTPDAVAVVDGGRHLTYRSLHSLASQLAHVLQQHGVGPEVMVGLYLDKSLELFMGLLGILKAGGAYVPFDPHSPIDRVSPMMDQADLTIILMRDRSRTTNFPSSSIQVIYLDEILSDLMTPIVQDLCVPIRSSMMAYMIFTSGSTGIPKGIVVSHYNMLNAYQAWAQAYHLRTQCTVHLQMAHVTFDVFTGDFIRALGSGGTLILCSRDTLLNPQKLYDLMKTEHVECAEFVPGVVKNLLDYVEETQNKLSFLRLLIVGSDVFEITDFRRLQQVCGSETRLINSYGLTETTIDSSYFEDVHGHFPQIGSVPIGRPLPNIHIFVLDQRQQPAPIGVTGEINVGGEGLSRGYWDRPDLTAERFLPHPTCQEPGTRLYRTGDLGRYYPNGNIQLLGRADHQVKVRGFRIELGEIEAVLQQHPAVQETVVLCQENEESGEKQLIAYVVLAQKQPLPLPSLRQFLREKLPAFMVPAFIVPLFEFPRLPSGKINRRGLPSSQHLTSTEDVVHRGPETVIEELLVKIWRELLNLPTVTVQDNFFELGGHSLLATRLLARLRGIGQSDLPLRIIFEHPILEDQALAIEEHLLKEIEYLHENEFLNFEDA